MKSTASSTAKAAGLKSLSQVAEMTGRNREVLHKWFKNNPEFFDIVIAGCVVKLAE